MKNRRRTEDGGRKMEDGGWRMEDGYLFFRNLINEESCEAIEAC